MWGIPVVRYLDPLWNHVEVADHRSDYRHVLLVPGGAVEARIHDPKLLAVLEASGGPGSVWQDVVVSDHRGREVYREGPYDGFRIGSVVARTAAEIRTAGFDSFLRRQRVDNKQLGPVQASGREIRFPVLRYLRVWFGSLPVRLKRNP